MVSVQLKRPGVQEIGAPSQATKGDVKENKYTLRLLVDIVLSTLGWSYLFSGDSYY